MELTTNITASRANPWLKVKSIMAWAILGRMESCVVADIIWRRNIRTAKQVLENCCGACSSRLQHGYALLITHCLACNEGGSCHIHPMHWSAHVYLSINPVMVTSYWYPIPGIGLCTFPPVFTNPMHLVSCK